MKKLILIMAITTTTSSYAEFFKCTDKNKSVHYQDQPCTYQKGKLAAYQPSGQYTQRDPIDVQNEITRVKNQVTENNNAIASRYYRVESNELINKPKREEAENQAKWDSLGRVGVTFYNSPTTYGQTRFAR